MPRTRTAARLLTPLALLALSACATTTGRQVEILRDPWGIPHVFAATDAGAFYGLGYATAEDRALQMTYALRIVQGRLSELVGEVRQGNRKDTSIDHDKKMRTFGFHRAAAATAARLDAATKDLLQAYCDGVNDCMQDQGDRLHPLFARLGLTVEPWTPADCLASWWHLGQFFATDGTRDLIAGRNGNRGVTPRMPPDEGPAVVQRNDVAPEWLERVERYAREQGMIGEADDAEPGPKFSHAWVVGGARTTTGSAVLVSDPQTPVRNPSLFYEFHLHGKTLDARGIGVPGSPIVLIGFTPNVAWGVTALGADQADLFLLDTDADHPDQYRFDGEWRAMQVRTEHIAVKGRAPIDHVVRTTAFGPVATAFCYALPTEGEVALRRVPLDDPGPETVVAAIAMMRARDVRELDRALAGWRFPSANMVFGDRAGDIGYRAVAAMPVRSRLDPSAGRHAMPCQRPEQEWQGFVPGELLPGVIDPAAGFIYSANHRPIGSWYPIPFGAMTGAGGDTVRSWRLRERLLQLPKFTPADVLAIHRDTVNPARRDIVRLALLAEARGQTGLSPDAVAALHYLQPWFRAGASSALDQDGAELALELDTFFRFVSTDLALVYGGGESGLAYFLKTAVARVAGDAEARLDADELAFLDQALAGAWQSAAQKYGAETAYWNLRARAAVRQRRLDSFSSLDGFPGLDPAADLSVPDLRDVDGGTIACQSAQSYTQWVPMHDPDQALSILPIGESERYDSPSRTSTLALWGAGELHPAPLSRARIEALGVSTTRLPVRRR